MDECYIRTCIFSSFSIVSTNALGFSPEFLGRVKLVTSIASLLGVGLYIGFLKNTPLRQIFFATTLVGTALGMTQVSLMPVLVLAERLCPKGMEATLFATLMFVSNGGSVLGVLIGAGLTQILGITKDRFDNWPP